MRFIRADFKDGSQRLLWTLPKSVLFSTDTHFRLFNAQPLGISVAILAQGAQYAPLWIGLFVARSIATRPPASWVNWARGPGNPGEARLGCK